MNLSWDAFNDNRELCSRVYRGSYLFGDIYATTGSTSVQVTNLNASSSYSFRVYAFDAAGNRSNDYVSVSVYTSSPPTTTTTTTTTTLLLLLQLLLQFHNLHHLLLLQQLLLLLQFQQ